MNANIGRNDPCPCGSGKKFKKCHLGREFELPREPETPEVQVLPPRPARTKKAAPPLNFAQTPRHMADALRELTRLASTGKDPEMAKLVAQTQEALAHFERQREREAACDALEARREEFLRWSSDEEAYIERTRTLFGESPFIPMRFTANEVKQACIKAGHVAPGLLIDEDAQIIRDAMLKLADTDRRRRFAMKLIDLLPGYVAAGRYIDGWIVQVCAYDTLTKETESNPFLFHMFAHGYDAWQQIERAREEKVLREAGLDIEQFRGMKADELEAWVQTHSADPKLRARMEAVLENNPDFKRQATDNLRKMEMDSDYLFEREDFRELHLTRQDIEPLIPPIDRQLEAWRNQHPEIDLSGEPNPNAADALKEFTFKMISDMAHSLFTQERIKDLIARLKKYRNDRFEAEDHRAANAALGAIVSLEREDSPKDNRFLLGLCFFSLKSMAVTSHSDSSERDKK